MKNSQKLKEEKRSLFDASQKIVEEVEKRESKEFTEDEQKTFDANEARMDALDAEIARAEKFERRLAETAGAAHTREQNNKEAREAAEGFNLLKAIRSQLPNQQLDGKELEMHQEAIKEARALGQDIQGVGIPAIILQGEKRDLTATGVTSVAGDQGGVLVPTLIGGFIEPLKAKMVLAKLGAQYLTGLSGNFNMPAGTAATATWEGEIDTNADAGLSFSKKSFGPKRLGAIIAIAKQLLFQGSKDAQLFAQNEILSAIALAVESAAINGAGTGNIPEGILNTAGIGSVIGGTDGAAPILKHIVGLETQVSVSNADIGSLGYLTNPSVRGKLKQTAKDPGSGLMVFGDGNAPLNGYQAGITTQVPSNLTKGTAAGVCSAIVFGNFKDLLIGQWGGMDIVVDPYTKKNQAEIELSVNSWWDVLVRRAKSFAAMQDALTA